MPKNVSTTTSFLACIITGAAQRLNALPLYIENGRVHGTCHQGGSTAASITITGLPCSALTGARR